MGTFPFDNPACTGVSSEESWWYIWFCQHSKDFSVVILEGKLPLFCQQVPYCIHFDGLTLSSGNLFFNMKKKQYQLTIRWNHSWSPALSMVTGVSTCNELLRSLHWGKQNGLLSAGFSKTILLINLKLKARNLLPAKQKDYILLCKIGKAKEKF